MTGMHTRIMAAVLMAASLSAIAQQKPNLVYILADDMGYGDPRCQNPASLVETPHIDRLAREGMRFTDAHAPASLCTPTRYGILTGRYAWRGALQKGVSRQYDPPLIEAERLTVGGMLQRQGYETACIGKWHLGWDWPLRQGGRVRDLGDVMNADAKERLRIESLIDFTKPVANGPITRGFNRYFGDDVPNYPPYAFIRNDRLTAEPGLKKPDSMYGHPGRMVPGWSLEAVMPDITDEAVRFIREMGKEGRHFFLFFALTAPHVPIAPSAAFLGRSRAGAYGDFVMESDWAVGQVMDALHTAGLDSNTIVVFTSDNGSPAQDGSGMAGAMNSLIRTGHDPNAPLRGMKTDLWEGGHRVPFVVRWPGRVAPGSISHATICHTDLMATMADILRYRLPEDAAGDSYSILPLLEGKRTGLYARPYTVHHSSEGLFAIRKGDWKLILTGGSGGGLIPYPPDSLHGKPVSTQLYNLRRDPGEKRNLAVQRPGKAKALRRWLASARALPQTK
jgi:arylsulfatase A-like enzyme